MCVCARACVWTRFLSLTRTYRFRGGVVTNSGLLEESVELEEVVVAGGGGEGLDLDGSGFKFGGRLCLGEGKQVSPLSELVLDCLVFSLVAIIFRGIFFFVSSPIILFSCSHETMVYNNIVQETQKKADREAALTMMMCDMCVGVS